MYKSLPRCKIDPEEKTALNSDHLRPLDVHRDLLAVADLIDLCFAQNMDSDGHEYVRQIRRAAQNTSFLGWVPGSHEHLSLPLSGYVWEEQGSVVGNLTLIPFRYQGQWLYMIANVAVHPEYRRLGIGRKLTQRALDHIRDHGASSAWLQVRDDNPVAHQLYLSLGFIERAWRTTWHYTPPGITPPLPPLPAGFSITARKKADWTMQHTWLSEIYPPEVAWNFPFKVDRFTPSFWRSALRFFNEELVEHWAAHSFQDFVGSITWEPGRFSQDILWIATSPIWEDHALQWLLPYVSTSIHNQHTLVVNYPAGRAVQAFQNANFYIHNTLVWMEVRYG
jgi:ribosomal protein S18 acetylase RimI-like enzyme